MREFKGAFWGSGWLMALLFAFVLLLYRYLIKAVPLTDYYQALFPLVFVLKVFFIAVTGNGILRLLGSQSRLPGDFWTLFFSSVAIGQIASACLLAISSPFLAMVHGAIPVIVQDLQLFSLFWIILVWFMVRRTGGITKMFPSIGFRQLDFYKLSDLLGVFLPLSLLLAASALVVNHLGSLGLDTLSHSYWSQDIVSKGYFSLLAKQTNLIEPYPKFFHLIVSSWLAGVPAPYVASMVKLMPFLQAFLSCLVVNELVRFYWQGKIAPRAFAMTNILMIAVVLYFPVRIANILYPLADLNGTPRLSSVAILLPSTIFAVIYISTKQWVFARLYWQYLMIQGLFWFGINPSLLIQYALFWLPFQLLIALTMRIPVHFRMLFNLRSSAVLGIFFGIGLLANPWLVARMHGLLPHEYQIALRERLDLSTVALERSLGNVGAVDFFVSDDSRAEICLQGSCLLRAGKAGFAEANASFFHQERESWAELVTVWPDTSRVSRAIQGFVFSTSNSFRAGGAYSWAMMMSLLIVGCAFTAILRPSRVSLGLCLTIVGLILCWALLGWYHRYYAEVFYQMLKAGSFFEKTEFALLGIYVLGGGLYFFPIYLWFPIPVAAFALAHALGKEKSDRDVGNFSVQRSSFINFTTVTLAVALVAHTTGLLIARHRGDLLAHQADEVLWGGEVATVRGLLEDVPRDQRIMIPAQARIVGNEKWVIADWSVMQVLPFVNQGLVFSSYFGYSTQLTFRDFNEWIRGTPEYRAKFRKRHNIRWLLLRDERSAAQEFYGKQKYFGLSLAELQLAFPPVRSSGEFALYQFKE